VQWLAAGDKNSKIFHLRASQRRKKNMIKALKRHDGTLTSDTQEMNDITINFFKDLYTSEGTNDMDAVLSKVPRKVTVEMNEALIAPFSEKEVKEALFQMFPTKAPGPDGYPAHFFQCHWDLCGKEVTEAVLAVLCRKEDLTSINDTIIVLIPKVASPEELGQFRPISLCNVIYKIVSKVAANRLKVILPDIISEEQSAFVPGRLITDNIITAYECLHFMKQKKPSELRCCALKLDMKKAYDRVEWTYLQAIMTKLGFHQLWVQLIMRLVSSVSFLVQLNGSCLESFKPTRGIRQGDPISPYLFLIAAEGLSCLLKSYVQSSELKGIMVAPTAPMVSHLLFADDSLLFFKANRESAVLIKNALQVYCAASGQQINEQKSSIHFAKKCLMSIRVEIKSVLNVYNECLSEKYLGMPSDVGSSSNGAFKYLKDRIWARIQGWMEQCLSSGGKEVLIKSVVQAIPTYSMACFKLPRGLCKHLTSLVRGFWWGSKEGKRKTSWVAWDDMVMPKSMGGLGFRDFESFNLALLAKQAWRTLKEPSSLSSRILKAVYFPNTDFLGANLGQSPSKIWRSILDGREVLQLGLIKRIGTGETTSIWRDDWLPTDSLRRPIQGEAPNQPQRVSELIIQSMASWDTDKLHQFFTPADVEVILNIPLSYKTQEDFWAWHYEKTGVFSVRSAYRMLSLRRLLVENAMRSNRKESEREWKLLWRVQVPPKVSVFLWRLARTSLPSADVLHQQNMADHGRCQICGADDS